MTEQDRADSRSVPAIDVDRLLVVVTGAVAACSTPGWLGWVREVAPELEITVVVTRSAERFVTRAALAAVTRGQVLRDEWADDGHEAVHVGLSEWAQAVLVFPATLDFVARLALGRADSPTMSALQTTSAPVVLAPALPPGAIHSHAYADHLTRLRRRRNVRVAPVTVGPSFTTGRPGLGAPTPLNEALRLLEGLRRELAPAGDGVADVPSSGTIVDAFGTGLLETTIERVPGGGYVWTHRRGRIAPDSFSVVRVPAGPADRAHAGVRWRSGGSGADVRQYAVRGRTSVAEQLLHAGPAAELVPVLHHFGATLARLHAAPLVGADGRPPVALQRLRRWLNGTSGQETDDVGGRLLAALRPHTLDGLRAALARLDACGQPVLCHGAPGLGVLVLDEDGTGNAELLIGEDLGVAAPAHDVGWVLGELIEMRWLCTGDAASWQALVDAFLDGYGARDTSEVESAAALRIALHLHDSSTYFQWDDQALLRWTTLLDQLTQLSPDSSDASSRAW